MASLLPLLLGVAFGLPGLALLVVAVLVTFGSARWLAGKLYGLTGDCYGAICEIVETAVLVAATALW
jgi:cobalamin synthase